MNFVKFQDGHIFHEFWGKKEPKWVGDTWHDACHADWSSLLKRTGGGKKRKKEKEERERKEEKEGVSRSELNQSAKNLELCYKR